MIRSKENTLGAWAFLLGVVLAVIIGLSASLIPIPLLNKYNTAIYAILLILGIIVGFVNISSKDSEKFMIAGVVLVLVSKFGMDSISGTLIGISVGDIVIKVFGALLALFVPATIIVTLKTVFSLAKI